MQIPAAQGFDEAMGFRFVEGGPDGVVLSWDVSPANHQPNGIVHGGTYCGVVETAASWAAAMWLVIAARSSASPTTLTSCAPPAQAP
jgi:acyl-coenzyme A thioesterase PaaI-like protein